MPLMGFETSPLMWKVTQTSVDNPYDGFRNKRHVFDSRDVTYDFHTLNTFFCINMLRCSCFLWKLVELYCSCFHSKISMVIVAELLLPITLTSNRFWNCVSARWAYSVFHLPEIEKDLQLLLKYSNKLVGCIRTDIGYDLCFEELARLYITRAPL